MVAHAKPKLIPLEPVRQVADHDCGPAAARSVLRHFGIAASRVDAIARPCRKNGTPPGRLADLFAAHGLGVGMRSGMTVRHLRELTEAGWPVLCPILFDGNGHWVVVRGVARNVIHLMDPATGLSEWNPSVFEDAWHDATADGVRLDRFGLAVFRPAA